jgi:4-hydroxy-3-methylbut-2-en-1-yl diphosphate synthase IspG/GcpE
MKVSWFRGDDEIETKHICPICAGWKTACPICGRVLFDEEGLHQHIRDKHNKKG